MFVSISVFCWQISQIIYCILFIPGNSFLTKLFAAQFIQRLWSHDNNKVWSHIIPQFEQHISSSFDIIKFKYLITFNL